MKLVDIESIDFHNALAMFVHDSQFCYFTQEQELSYFEGITAYDIDSVVDLLEKNAQSMSTVKPPHKYFRAIGTRKAISIVRSGGVSAPTKSACPLQ